MTTFLPTNQIIGEYGNEQSFQYQKEGLDLEFFDTQSNYVDYPWEVLYRARNLFTALRASEKQEKIRKYKKKALHILYFFLFSFVFSYFFKPPKA